MDLNAAKYTEPDTISSILDGHFRYWEKDLGIKNDGLTISERFKVIIRRAYEKTGQKVVILVDEYDKPLLEAIGNEALQYDYRKTLKSIYGLAKIMDSYIQMAFFTGGN